MGHFLHFGAGPNQLPEPWQNLGGDHDIRKPLRFASDSASFIFAEHVLEHVPFLAGMGFLSECWRVLELGGVLRLSIPDVSRFVGNFTDGGYELNGRSGEYARALHLDSPREALQKLLTGYGHQCAWTEASLAGALVATGFQRVDSCTYGTTPLPGGLSQIDGHHKSVGIVAAALESSILEARK